MSRMTGDISRQQPLSQTDLWSNPRTDRALHPRPQQAREQWTELHGQWLFAYDDENRGRREGWHATEAPFERAIAVPYPPESPASGIGDTGFHPVVWYRRTVTREDLVAAGHGEQGDRVLLHFAAVDYVAHVWFAGQYLGHHEGGSTPFHFDVTPLLDDTAAGWPLVVCAEDDPHDAGQPRGKQDWQRTTHGIWYDRTTGIWQPVWLEAVPDLAIADLAWSSDIPDGSVTLSLELSQRPRTGAKVSVTLSYEDRLLAAVSFTQWGPRGRTVIDLPAQANGQAHESLLWSPENPRLLQAKVTVEPFDGAGQRDEVASYLGLRSAGWAHGHFLLNDRPCYLRSVLEQGFWPESHLAAPSAEALYDEVQLIKSLGFNAVRVHQKNEDPRFLYWCDRLGLLVWSEAAAAYEFSTTAVERSTREWLEIVRRDISHPSIVAWVPLNESWGVQHISHDPRQLDYAQALYHLTRALDPTRPVISNDGWELADSDIWTIHDYSTTGPELAARYTSQSTLDELMNGVGPALRRMKLVDVPDRGQPYIVSEFGGVSYAPTHDGPAWGYVTTSDAAGFESALRDLFGALQRSPVLGGFCYTQLTDTQQEANGLTDPYRRPKLPVETIRSIVLGEGIDTSELRRPHHAVEQHHEAPAE